MPGYRELLESYQDELRGYEFYNQLAQIAPTSELSAIYASMARDEYAHARTLATLMSRWAGAHALTENVPMKSTRPFREGVEQALDGELADTAKYAQFAREAETLELKLVFYSIAGDEYGHARTSMAILAILP